MISNFGKSVGMEGYSNPFMTARCGIFFFFFLYWAVTCTISGFIDSLLIILKKDQKNICIYLLIFAQKNFYSVKIQIKYTSIDFCMISFCILSVFFFQIKLTPESVANQASVTMGVFIKFFIKYMKWFYVLLYVSI